MNPDYTKMVEEFCKPVLMLFLLIVTMLVVSVAWQIWKENLIYRRKLGKD